VRLVIKDIGFSMERDTYRVSMISFHVEGTGHVGVDIRGGDIFVKRSDSPLSFKTLQAINRTIFNSDEPLLERLERFAEIEFNRPNSPGVI
jgi:cephalosporin-C deacetylase-like acetyl esterase